MDAILVPKPPKELNLLDRVRRCVAKGLYLETQHAKEQMRKRDITRLEIWHVLTDGWHEKQKDKFNDVLGAWNYAIRGLTADGNRHLRVIVALGRSGGGVLVITAIDLDVDK